jgi:hypothetical protein
MAPATFHRKWRCLPLRRVTLLGLVPPPLVREWASSVVSGSLLLPLAFPCQALESFFGQICRRAPASPPAQVFRAPASSASLSTLSALPWPAAPQSSLAAQSAFPRLSAHAGSAPCRQAATKSTAVRRRRRESARLCCGSGLLS